MAYVTGNAASFLDLKTAIENACVANGWTLTNTILSKNGCFVKLQATTARITISGGNSQSGTALRTACSKFAKIFNPTYIGTGAVQIVFPIAYEIYIFEDPDEVYCVINYNSDFYQQISFGISNVTSLPGTGNWFSASSGSDVSESSNAASLFSGSVSSSGFGLTGMTSGFPFCHSATSNINAFIHSNLDSIGWNYVNGSALGNLKGQHHIASLIAALPNLFNQACVLLPLKVLVVRSSSQQSIVAQLKNIRLLRIDNNYPGEIITLGSDQWKIYPHFRKDSSTRILPNATHSGTFGVAIKYEGV